MASTMTTRAGSKQLMRVLAPPSKIANALDWRRSTGGAIATIDIHADRIGVRISQHPKTSSATSPPKLQQTRYSLPVSPRGRTRIPASTREQLSDLVHRHKVCGFVVAWPIQEDTGLMGAACGRTLFAIEELLRTSDDASAATTSSTTTSKRPVFAPNRPLCLWDAGGHVEPITDAFGRSPLYARTTDKIEHFASKEQYHQDESVVVSGIWDDFVRTHWPSLDRRNSDQPLSSSKKNNHHSRGDDEETPAPPADIPTLWDGDDSSSRKQRQAAI